MDACRRTRDVIVAALVLVLGLPFVAPLALALRLSRPGPLLVGRDRVGERPFTQYRFALTGRNGRRAWPGRWLCATGLERWPLWWHVLTGQMTLVGPSAPDAFLAEGLVDDASLHRDMVLHPHGWRPGVFGAAPCSEQEDGFTILRDRVLFDLPWMGRWPDERRAWCPDPLAVCFSEMLAAWRFSLSCWRRSPAGNEVVRVDLGERPLRHAPVRVSKLRTTPSGVAAECHCDRGRQVFWWYPRRCAGLALPERGSLAGGLLASVADKLDLVDAHTVELTRRAVSWSAAEVPPDVITVELPAGLHCIDRVCELLDPLWRALAAANPADHDLALDMHVLVLASAAHVARLGAGRARVLLRLEVAHDGIHLRASLAAPVVTYDQSDSRVPGVEVALT